MGRSAHRLDKEEKKARNRLEYSNTSHAKELRSAQNRRAYQRRTAHESKLKPTWPRIPKALKELAGLSIPKHAHFFILELKATDSPGHNDPLAVWDDFPPYSSAPDNKFTDARLEALTERVHARQFAYHKAYEVHRLPQLRSSKNTDDNLKVIDGEINTNLSEFRILRSLLNSFESNSVNYAIGHVHMQWKARRVMALLEDWRALKKDGVDGIMVLYCNRW